MTTINKELKTLKTEVEKLKSKVESLSRDVESKSIPPYSKVGSKHLQGKTRPIDIATGLGLEYGGNMIWNDAESKLPPYNQKPDEPTKGYNKHGHSRYAGGALDINTLELIDYDVDFDTSLIYNKHSQGFWRSQPSIKTVVNSQGQSVEKIGNLDITFDPDTRKWKAGGLANIDIKKTLLVEYDEDPDSPTYGQIIHQSTLWNEDETKSSVIWDEDAEVYRFLAVYSD